MRITWDTTVDELMHSEEPDIRYIDLAEGELMHWKYVKREKLPGGGWRYYYDQSELDKAKRAADNAKRASDAATSRANMSRAARDYRNKERNKDGRWDANDARGAAEDEVAYRSKASYAATAKSNADAYAKRYQKMKVNSFLPRTISKGAVAVANLASKVASLFRKKK